MQHGSAKIAAGDNAPDPIDVLLEDGHIQPQLMDDGGPVDIRLPHGNELCFNHVYCGARDEALKQNNDNTDQKHSWNDQQGSL